MLVHILGNSTIHSQLSHCGKITSKASEQNQFHAGALTMNKANVPCGTQCDRHVYTEWHNLAKRGDYKLRSGSHMNVECTVEGAQVVKRPPPILATHSS